MKTALNRKKSGRQLYSAPLRTILFLFTLTTRCFHASHSYAFQPGIRIDIRHKKHVGTPIYAGNRQPNRTSQKRRSKKEIQIDLQHQFTALREIRIQSGLKHPSKIDATFFSTLESNVLNSIWSSRTVSEVYDILRQLVLSSKSLIHKVSNVIPKKIAVDDEEDDLQLVCSGLRIVGPNIAAAALRRIIDVRPDFNMRRGGDEDTKLARSLMPVLVEVVARAIAVGEKKNRPHAFNQKDVYSFSNLNASMYHALNTVSFNNQMTHISCANIFYALAKVSILQKKNGYKSGSSSLRFLVERMCTNILERENDGRGDGMFTKRVNPTLLLETLCSLSTFKMKNEVQVLHIIGNRLKLGDATGKLSGRQLSLGLWAYASLERPHLGVLKSFSRRLRKANIRKEMSCVDISRASWAVGQSMKQLDLITQNEIQRRIDSRENDFESIVGLISDEEVASLREESATMVYTLANELMQPEKTSRDVRDLRKKLHGLNMCQVADLLTTYVIFEFDPFHPLMAELEWHIQDMISTEDGYTAVDIARILWSLQRLRRPVNTEFVTELAQSFDAIVEARGSESCSPKTFNTIIRSIALMLPDHGKCLPAIQNTMSALLSDSAFLSKCNEFECSNFIWSLSLARNYDKKLLGLLSNRMRDEDILSSCTPSSASRFLWSFTSLVESGPEDLEMKEVLFEMFQSLGGILLSTQLTPVDASSAMWAMAKSSYSLDMGIFDHLAEVLAVDFMLENATVQQIAEACWSCGRMITWEDPLREKMEFGEAKIPPYVKNGEKFASHLVSKCDQMSSKDISQTIWAIGRLKVNDDAIISPLVNKATLMAREQLFNSQELANIVWALSKTNFDDKETISTLTTEIRKPSLMDRLTPQEAANVLYALGKMRIRDEDTFSSMNEVLMKDLEKSTTQTITNALWAHECVQLKPPRILFDSWAKEKLDIVGLFSLDNDPNGLEIIMDEEKK